MPRLVVLPHFPAMHVVCAKDGLTVWADSYGPEDVCLPVTQTASGPKRVLKVVFKQCE